MERIVATIVRDLYAENPFYKGRPEPLLYNCPQTEDGEPDHPDDTPLQRIIKEVVRVTKSFKWLAVRTLITASAIGSLVGANPYDKQDPETRYKIMTGEIKDDFNGNIDTMFGELHEPRLRGVGMRALQLLIVEYGMFRDKVCDFMGVSPDGVTDAFIMRGLMADGLTPFEFKAGSCMYEAKCSRKHEYMPKAAHLMQLHMQCYVRGVNCGIMHYMNGISSTDQKEVHKLVFVVFSMPFWIWVFRRAALFVEHVRRRVPLSNTDPYFRNTRHDYVPSAKPSIRERIESALAAEIEEAFLHKPVPGRAPRFRGKPLTLDDWEDEMRKLGMTTEEWRAIPGYGALTAPRITKNSSGVEVCNDGGQMRIPPRPEMYLIYEQRREVPPCERKVDDQYYLQPVDETDKEFFDANYETVVGYNARMLSERSKGIDIDGERGKLYNLPRLFVTEIERAPHLDRPVPADSYGTFESDEARLAFEKRLAAQKERFDKTVQERVKARLAEEDAKPQPVVRDDINNPYILENALSIAAANKLRREARAEMDKQTLMDKFLVPKRSFESEDNASTSVKRVAEPTVDMEAAALRKKSWRAPILPVHNPMPPILTMDQPHPKMTWTEDPDDMPSLSPVLGEYD